MKYFISLISCICFFVLFSSAQAPTQAQLDLMKRNVDNTEKNRERLMFLAAPTYKFVGNNFYKIRASNGKYLALSPYGQLILTKDQPGDYKEYWAFFITDNAQNADPNWLLIESAYTGEIVTMKNGKTNDIYRGGPFGILGLSHDLIGYFDCQSFRLVTNGSKSIVNLCPKLQDGDGLYSTRADAGGTTPIVLLNKTSDAGSQQWEIIPAAEVASQDRSALHIKNLGIISAYYRDHPYKDLAWDQAAGEPYNPNPIPAAWQQSDNASTNNTVTAKPEKDLYPTTDEEKAKVAERARIDAERKQQEDQARADRQAAEKQQQEDAQAAEAAQKLQKVNDMITAAIDKKNTPVPVSQSGSASTGWPANFSQEGVVVYMGENFTGDNDQFTKPTKFISFKKSIRRWHNNINSVKVAPGWVAYLYSGDDLNGPRLEITGEWTLSQNPEWKNRVQAIAVYKH